MVHAWVFLQCLRMIMSSSETRSSHTSPQEPRQAGSNVSEPSMSARVRRIAGARRLGDAAQVIAGTRRTPMAPASTKYLSAMSSTPLEHKMTFAPASIIIFTRRAVMSSSS